MENTFDLSFFFRTRAEAEDFKARIASISEKIYEAGFDLDHVLLETLGIQKKDKFVAILRSANINLQSAAELNAFLEKLAVQISSLPVLSLTIAFEPQEQTLRTISNWFTTNLKKQILLDIKVDPNIIAGSTILVKGHFLDFSAQEKFNRIFEQMMGNKTGQILSVPQANQGLDGAIANGQN